MRYLGILILLMFFTPIQAQQIGLVQTRSFYDRDHGLKQLIRSLEARKLIDLDYGKRKSGYTIMDGEHIGDITERFINHYNRSNP